MAIATIVWKRKDVKERKRISKRIENPKQIQHSVNSVTIRTALKLNYR